MLSDPVGVVRPAPFRGLPHATGSAGGFDSVVEQPESEVVDGGSVDNPHREKADDYLSALGKVSSAEEEAQHLTEFAAWLNKNDYRIRVEEAEGKHVLSCPYFPPVTPWTAHTFIDIKNLELLPRLSKDE